MEPPIAEPDLPERFAPDNASFTALAAV